MQKTLFIIRELSGGGAEKVFVDVLNGLKANGCTVEVLVLFPGGERFSDLAPTIPVHVVYPSCSFRALTAMRLMKWVKFPWLLRRDVLHCLGAHAFETTVSFVEGVPLLLQSWIPAKRRVAWVRTDLLENHYTKVFFKGDDERRLYGAMDAILFVGRAALQQFQLLFPGLPNRHLVLYDPIDVLRIRQLAQTRVVPKRKVTLCSVGRLSPEKGVDRLIVAAHQLRQEGLDFDLWVVGEGTEREMLEREVARLGLTDVVFFMGFQKNPYPFLGQADLFVSPSRAEGFPLVVCEALSLGIPVVSTRTAGPQELLADDHGVLCDHSVEALTAALKGLIVSVEKRAYYASRARERAEMFDTQRSLREIEKMVFGMERDSSN